MQDEKRQYLITLDEDVAAFLDEFAGADYGNYINQLLERLARKEQAVDTGTNP